MTTLYSKANLRDQALVALGVLDPTESADAQTVARVDPILQQMIEGLDDENLLIFDPSTNETTDVIPSRVMLAMKELAEYELGPGYGRPRDAAYREGALRRLRRSVLEASNDIPTIIENF